MGVGGRRLLLVTAKSGERRRALAFRQMTAGVMAADPARRWGRVSRGGEGGWGAVITSQAHPPSYLRAIAFFLRVQLRARLAVPPRGILEPE